MWCGRGRAISDKLNSVQGGYRMLSRPQELVFC